MDINYHNENIIEAELVNEHEIFTVVCSKCGDVWKLDEKELYIAPNMYFRCSHCGEWISLY